MENKSENQSASDDLIIKKPAMNPSLMESGILTPLKIQEGEIYVNIPQGENNGHHMVKRSLLLDEQ
jgi:hypothetical protein